MMTFRGKRRHGDAHAARDEIRSDRFLISPTMELNFTYKILVYFVLYENFAVCFYLLLFDDHDESTCITGGKCLVTRYTFVCGCTLGFDL